MSPECGSSYTDGNTYLTYHCRFDANHEGLHEDIAGPGMRWAA